MKRVAAFALAFGLITGQVAAKEGMTATLLTHVPMNPMLGKVRIAWKLDTAAARSARGADDDRYYVRLLSATGASSTHAYGALVRRHYVATVAVPRGGIRRVEIRLKGWMSTPSGTRRADMLIPLTNDPF